MDGLRSKELVALDMVCFLFAMLQCPVFLIIIFISLVAYWYQICFGSVIRLL